jgi:hypothetical protein
MDEGKILERFSLQTVQTGSGFHPASCSMLTRGSFPAVKWLGHKVDHSPSSSAESKKQLSYTSMPKYLYVLMACTQTTLTLI